MPDKKQSPKSKQLTPSPPVNLYEDFHVFLNDYMRAHKKAIGAPPHFDTVYLEPRFFDKPLFTEMAKEFIGKQYVRTVKK